MSEGVGELRVREWENGGVRELAGAGAFEDALKQITQLMCFFRQYLKPFRVSAKPCQHLEPVAALVRFLHRDCDFMGKVIATLGTICFMVIGTNRTRALAQLMRNNLYRYVIRQFAQILEHLYRVSRSPLLQRFSKITIGHI